MPEAIERPRADLFLYTSVSYVCLQGAGIGVVQRPNPVNFQQTLNLKRKYGFPVEILVRENIETGKRAHILALCRAFELAQRTITQYPNQVQKVMVHCESPKVVKTINQHIECASKLSGVKNTKNRSMITKTIAKAQRFTSHGVQISITTNAEGEEWKQARKLARQSGRKARRPRRSRRQLRLVQQKSIQEQEVSRKNVTSQSHCATSYILPIR